MSTDAFDTAMSQARDLLRWRSPLRTELWAAKLTTTWDNGDQFIARARSANTAESRLTITALTAIKATPTTHQKTPAPNQPTPEIPAQPTLNPPAQPGSEPPANPNSETTAHPSPKPAPQQTSSVAATASPASSEAPATPSPPRGWMNRMGKVICEGAWYGKADPYGEQMLAALAFRYENGKEPHVLVVGIDQVNGGLAVDAVIEEVKFLDDLNLNPTTPQLAAGKILDAFDLTDTIMGAATTETLPAVRPLALTRAHTIPDPIRHAPDNTAADFTIPDVPGADAAFEALKEYLGERPLWWSPDRASRFLLSWLPREALLTDAAIAAIPEVLHAWTRYIDAPPAVLHRIDEDAPRLPLLMADDSLASLGKRIARQNRP